MGYLYASVHGTSVLRLAPESMPEAPPQLMAVVWLILADEHILSDERIVCPILQHVLDRAIAVGRPLRHRYGRKVTVRFETKEEAAAALKDAERCWPWFETFPHKEPPKNQTKKEDWAFVHGYMYNEARYSERKWTIFESGLADFTEALLRNEKPTREVHANSKLVKLTFAGQKPWGGFGGQTSNPERVIEETEEQMDKAVKSEDSGELKKQLKDLRNEASRALKDAKKKTKDDPTIKRMAEFTDANRFSRRAHEFFEREQL